MHDLSLSQPRIMIAGFNKHRWFETASAIPGNACFCMAPFK